MMSIAVGTDGDPVGDLERHVLVERRRRAIEQRLDRHADVRGSHRGGDHPMTRPAARIDRISRVAHHRPDGRGEHPVLDRTCRTGSAAGSSTCWVTHSSRNAVELGLDIVDERGARRDGQTAGAASGPGDDDVERVSGEVSIVEPSARMDGVKAATVTEPPPASVLVASTDAPSTVRESELRTAISTGTIGLVTNVHAVNRPNRDGACSTVNVDSLRVPAHPVAHDDAVHASSATHRSGPAHW